MLKRILHEDNDLLVVNKPAGLNTHAPSPHAGEGIYDWLRNREPRWATLATIHRLDKETSGILVFSKTRLANKSLTDQFARRFVCKKYFLLTDRPVPKSSFTAATHMARVGDKYVSQTKERGGEYAETRFQVVRDGPQSIAGISTQSNLTLVQAEPVTGRTHQIRVHAAENGFPILGDKVYGGFSAARVFLHAATLQLRHPASGKLMTFTAPVDFDASDSLPSLAIRDTVIDPELNNACRVIHGSSDGRPGWYVDRVGDFLLSQSEKSLSTAQLSELRNLMTHFSARGASHKILRRKTSQVAMPELSPQPVLGDGAPESFVIRENNLLYELSFQEGYSIGLFLDQRDNRHRLQTKHISAGLSLVKDPQASTNSTPELLNTFSYTCAFSICAAVAGFRTTSLDLSKKYLEWGKRNFVLNNLDPAQHDFVYGDTLDWLRRLHKKSRQFDVILLDPPTFSQSKEHGQFRVEKDLTSLVANSLPLLKPGGVLFASSNAAEWPVEKFLVAVEAPIHAARRKIIARHYAPQPPDFPISKIEPAYLKTIWLRLI